MGRNNKRGGRRGNKPKDDVYRTDLVEKSDMHNERFTTYYQTQKIVPEDEWDAFMESMRAPLPTTFRVAGSRQTAQSLNATLRDKHVPALNNVVFEDQSIPPPVQIPWYPDGLAWQFNVPKKVLRKQPEFKEFHSFLVFETEVGNVSRQEAVSMLPPLFMDVEPHHKVMDMCAAPGSKTAQLLEALHAQDTLTSTSIPSGVLLANDSDHKRTHLLIHQSARLPSPALLVTNLDASIYPQLKIPSPNNPARMEPLFFDRILCDVPCSGDGTLRKNLGIWKTWQPMEGNGLHGLQLRILQRAMKMLAPQGRIVYSTCSLNPVENEAVVAGALRSNPDFRLVDVSAKLPALRWRPGLTAWRPTDKSLCTTYDTYETFMATCTQGEMVKAKMTRGHWPPEDVEALELPRCLRIYPHLQDTGGFFVAVLERTSTGTTEVEAPREKKRGADEPAEIPESKKPRLDSEGVVPKVEDAAETPAETDAVAEVATKNPAPPKAGKQKKGEGGGSFKENPYTFLPPDDPSVVSCVSRLHLTPSFPSSNVLVRAPAPDPDADPDASTNGHRNLYITNDLVKLLVTHNDYNRIRLTCAGTKVFTKQEAGRGGEAQFRVLGEALPLVIPYTDPATIVEGDMGVLTVLVEKAYPLISAFPEGPFRTALMERETGSHIVRFPCGLDGVLSHDLLLPLWKSPSSLTLMIDKKAKSALSMRVFGKDITSPVKEKPVVVSADAVEGDDLDAGDAVVKADEDGGNDAVDMDAGEAVKTDAVMVDAE
ncbi:S-adenosyl-L-methionine-dependent methyltransferase [Mycena albidolilacea]|uniref:S-adenosyl-L-methionine-dependent methyltransferase n=1 Tax=Mycena albidolilacea TaxID=1033008 RepID=A0AAD6ZGU8_9AGAR|nr:S-adenosyl-L-methionine-dependent methyltransferase [Mycena albidolilacea]